MGDNLIVGICSFDLFLPENRSLKGKRKVLRSVKDRVRGKFNVSIAEVGSLDSWQRSSLGIACVSNERGRVESVLSRAIEFIDNLHLATLENIHLEIL